MESKLNQALVSWGKLNQAIAELREDQVKELLDHETANGKRPDIILRLHQRFNKLRVNRERAELLGGSGLF
jgi:hypothetical protein